MAYTSGFFDNYNQYGSIKGNLGDYQHASRVFRSNNYRLAPKFRHLYHVVLNIDPTVRNISPLRTELYVPEVNLLCKTVDLPQYNVDSQVLNQYNRKKLVQTRVDYSPITITYHDDNAGLSSLLWEAYFRYYFTDSNYTQRNTDGTPATSIDAYKKGPGGINSIYTAGDSQNKRYGLDRPNKQQQFFTSIQVYQLSPQNTKSTFTSFTLINPKIDVWKHDTMAAEGSDFSENTLTVSYEAVMYNRGYTQVGNAPQAFAEFNYDGVPSPYTPDTTLNSNTSFNIAGAANNIEALQDANRQSTNVTVQTTLQSQKNVETTVLNAIDAVTTTNVGGISISDSASNADTTDATPSGI